MRYDATLPDDFVNSAANLILLCPNCHTQIDKKENENDYSPENLYEYKDQDIVHTYLPEFLSDVNHVLNWADMNNITTENKHLFDQQINFVLNKYTKKLRDMGIAENIIDGFLRECNNILCDAEFHHDLF